MAFDDFHWGVNWMSSCQSSGHHTARQWIYQKKVASMRRSFGFAVYAEGPNVSLPRVQEVKMIKHRLETSCSSYIRPVQGEHVDVLWRSMHCSQCTDKAQNLNTAEKLRPIPIHFMIGKKVLRPINKWLMIFRRPHFNHSYSNLLHLQ